MDQEEATDIMKATRKIKSIWAKNRLLLKIGIRNMLGAGIRLKIEKGVEIGKDVRFGLHKGSELVLKRNCVIGLGCEFLVEGGGKARIGELSVIYEGVSFEVSSGAELMIGKNIILNRYSMLHAHKKITIDDFSSVGEMVSIRDNDKDYSSGKLLHDAPLVAAPVSIGKDTWLCAKVTVTRGVSIGDQAIVGANSVVTKNIPKGEVWGGVPAKFIKTRKKRD